MADKLEKGTIDEDAEPRRVHVKQEGNAAPKEMQPRPAKKEGIDLLYTIEECPPWYTGIFLGLQHYFTMFGATVAVPFAIAPALCIADNPLALSEIISTIFFVSGVVTLLQTTIGNRLPIVQGSTFSFLAPTFSILALEKFSCSRADPDWKMGMREIQGAIMVSSLFQILVGFTGIIGFMLRFIGPLTVAPTIALVGLSLYEAAGNFAGTSWAISAPTVLLIILFSQVVKNVRVPLPWFNREKSCHLIWCQVFKMFPVLLSIIVAWGFCAILTAAGGFTSDSTRMSYKARTDARIEVLREAEWFRFPYPGQWGTPTVSAAGVFGMLAGVLASMIESIGDYYACARLCAAPPPPRHAVNRGIAIEGIGCLLAGAWGSGNGTTSFSENIGAIGITKVGSRRVVQIGAAFMILLSIFGKFGALFTTIPEPIIGAMFWALFGMIASVGLSNLQFIDMNSSRNLFVLGFSLFTGLVVPFWVAKNSSAIDTGNNEVDQILRVLLSTNMAVGGVVAMILDNLLPGTIEERGILAWRECTTTTTQSPAASGSSVHCYDIPLVTKYLQGKRWVRFIPFLPYYPDAEERNQYELE